MEFLNGFEKRMKSVGRYTRLIANSINKGSWKQYGIESVDEQMNIVFTVLLYIMEKSLKKENCTLDDITFYISNVNDLYFKRPYGYDDCKEMADFIVNTILCNSGNVMYFTAYNYEKREYENIGISFVSNKVVYLDNNVRRTSYSLTEDGYNMVLSTMEIEDNMKITIHELLFKLHLEKADYDQAVNDIKNIFDRLRIQNQKIQEAMHRIRKNALSYSVEEYEKLIKENIATVDKTREKFGLYRNEVNEKVKQFEEDKIRSNTFDEKDQKNLDNLKIICSYLNMALDEHQKILGDHFDLKNLYDRELENYVDLAMIKRYDLRTEIYQRILENPWMLENVGNVLRPLYFRKPDKIYNLNLAFEEQARQGKRAEDDTEELLFDEEEYLAKQEELRKQKLKKYRNSVRRHIVVGDSRILYSV